MKKIIIKKRNKFFKLITAIEVLYYGGRGISTLFYNNLFNKNGQVEITY